MNATFDNANGEEVNYQIRPSQREDVAALARFSVALNQLEPTVESYSETFNDYFEWYNSPASLEYSRWQANLRDLDGNAGVMIGRAAVHPPNPEGIAFGAVAVHPDYRNRGLGRALYGLVEQQAQAWAVKELNIEGNQRHTLLREFLARRGFEFNRYSWEMLLPSDYPVPAAEWPGGFSVRTFVRGQDEQLYYQVLNEGFADHFAHSEVPFSQILYWINMPSFNPDGVFFAFAGEQPAGICVAIVHSDDRDEGWIEDLAVLPAYRRGGVGRALLLTGVNWLRQRVSKVKLGVEGKNGKALPLYTSVGFQQHDGRFIMTKTLG